MKLHYAETINGRKACVAARHLDAPVTFVRVNLGRNEQASPAFLRMNPNGRVPVLELADRTIWESNAIMAWLARHMRSDLYPDEDQTVDVIRWLSWSSEHFNRYASRLYFEYLIKPQFNLGAPDAAMAEEAKGYVRRYAAVLDAHLADRRWMIGDRLTIVDFAVGAALPYAEAAQLPLQDFAGIRRWSDRLNALPAWRDPYPPATVAA